MLKALGVIRSWGGALTGLVLLYKRPEGVYLCLYHVRMQTEGFPQKHWLYVYLMWALLPPGQL